jgi:hypothetical protein
VAVAEMEAAGGPDDRATTTARLLPAATVRAQAAALRAERPAPLRIRGRRGVDSEAPPSAGPRVAPAAAAAAAVAGGGGGMARAPASIAPAAPVSSVPLDAGGATAAGSSRQARAQKRQFTTAMESVGAADSDALRYGALQARAKRLCFRRSHIHAWGLFALEPIAEGGMVAEYVGQIIAPSVRAAHRTSASAQRPLMWWRWGDTGGRQARARVRAARHWVVVPVPCGPAGD